MSRIGKQPISIPKGVTFNFSKENHKVSVKGPKGTLSRDFPGQVTIKIEGSGITFTPNKVGDKTVNALWGTYASHVKNMVDGVNTGYTKKLVLEGVGFKSDVAGQILNLALGFSHPVKVTIPEGITVTAEKNNIPISGIDKDSLLSTTL